MVHQREIITKNNNCHHILQSIFRLSEICAGCGDIKVWQTNVCGLSYFSENTKKQGNFLLPLCRVKSLAARFSRFPKLGNALDSAIC